MMSKKIENIQEMIVALGFPIVYLTAGLGFLIGYNNYYNNEDVEHVITIEHEGHSYINLDGALTHSASCGHKSHWENNVNWDALKGEE